MRKALIDASPPCIKCQNPIDHVTYLDHAAIDLPLGDGYYEMQASCRPGPNWTVMDLINKYQAEPRGRRNLENPTRLLRDKTYLIELPWSLDLPPDICARATAKSSIGRLDALVRLIADYEYEFETVQRSAGPCAKHLYLEVRPNTFDLEVRPGKALSQLRFFHGEERHCTLSPELLDFEQSPPLINPDGSRAKGRPIVGDWESMLLTLNLEPDAALGFSGFVAKEPARLPFDPDGKVIALDPTKRGHERYDPKAFWEEVRTDGCSVKIEQNRFYLFRSIERFELPAHLAVDCRAVSESLGDIRIHYAGFAHPFFGARRKGGRRGAPLIFEVRGYQFPTILHHGTALAKIAFRRMSAPAPEPQSVDDDDYTHQELQLSKCFAPWTKE